MDSAKKTTWLNAAAVLCGLWFVSTSFIWLYYANLVISFPVGLLGMYLWMKARRLDKDQFWNKVALVLHLLGFLSAFVSLGLLLFAN